MQSARMMLLFLALCAFPAVARDRTGLSAQLTADQGAWVSGLSTPAGGRCCDDADGLDPIWRISEASPTGYSVWFENHWIDVEPGHLITEPNLIGVARVWIYWQGSEPFVRCFMPGPGG